MRYKPQSRVSWMSARFKRFGLAYQLYSEEPKLPEWWHRVRGQSAQRSYNWSQDRFQPDSKRGYERYIQHGD
jgi:hypothetical protein